MFGLCQDLPLAWGLGGPNRLPGNCTLLHSFTAFVSPDMYGQLYICGLACMLSAVSDIKETLLDDVKTSLASIAPLIVTVAD